MIFLSIALLVLSVAVFLNLWLAHNNREIAKIQLNMIKILRQLIDHEAKNNEFQDKEILLLSEKLENFEKEISDKISKKDFADALRKIEENFAFENQKIFEKVEKIDDFQKRQNVRLLVLEGKPLKKLQKEIIGENEKIFTSMK